ncbi:unnamed protein product [Aspergillus oryzae]|nr:unnamed protein product [Aspergillus oryzae]GMF96842.1 unnamed protein product [Aspergillus oryzae]
MTVSKSRPDYTYPRLRPYSLSPSSTSASCNASGLTSNMGRSVEMTSLILATYVYTRLTNNPTTTTTQEQTLTKSTLE